MSARASMWRRRLPLLTGAFLFAAGNLALFFGYRSSTEARRTALEARRDDLRRTVEAHEAEAAKLAGQRGRLSEVSSAIEEFYGKRIGPERETLAAVVGELHAILKEAGVAAPQISYATAVVQKLPLSQMRISFPVRCDYARFKKLLHAFEASRRWLVVRGISIGKDTDQPGSVQVQIELVTYFAEREGAPEKAERAERPEKAARGAVPVRKAGA